MNKPSISLCLLALLLLTGCATLPDDERAELDRMAEKTINRLTEKNPQLEGKLDACLGYLVADKKVVKIPMIGTGGGQGVVVDKTTGQRTYVKLSRIEVGGGWGARNYKVLLLLNDEKRLKKALTGTVVYEFGAEASAGKAALEGSSGQLQDEKGYEVYTLSEGGASATFTLRAIRLKPYRD